MANYKVTDTELTGIANAIRTRGGTSAQLEFPDDFSSAIGAIGNSYVQGDEGKVVSNGALVAQTARSSNITENGTYDTTLNNSITVDVEGSGGGYPYGSFARSEFEDESYVFACNAEEVTT